MAKSPRAYRDISEAAAEVGVEAHVLRFWERELPFVKPLKRAGGRRFYRPRDVDVLREVHRLRGEGRSLGEIRRLAAERRLTPEPRPADPAPPAAAPDVWPRDWSDAYQALAAAKRRLDDLLGSGVP